jgi:hypothetical protein
VTRLRSLLTSVLRGLGWKRPCPHTHQRIIGLDGDNLIPCDRLPGGVADGFAKHECVDCGYVWNRVVRIVRETE